jgi:DNA-binding transcriptional regulator YhcF (GntR family)
MSAELEILNYLKDHRKELIPVQGLSIRIEPLRSGDKTAGPDFLARVSFKNVQFRLIGEIILQVSSSMLKAKLSLLKSHVGKDESLVPLLVAKYLSPDRRKQCQKEGICFLDLSGNVFLEYDGLYVERIGFPNRFPEKRRGRGPFSDKASLIIRAAFSDIKRVWGVRELAKSVGLDPGFVSRMAQELEKRNYISRSNSKLRLREPKSLLGDWVREYNHGRNREKRYFCLAKGPEEIIDKLTVAQIPKDILYALGLHAGASLVSPYAIYNEVYIYIQNESAIRWFRDKLKLREAEKGANLIFLLPHYKHSVFYDMQRIRNLWVVSDLQLYLDLHNYPIRGREQAEHLYEKRLKHIIES